MNYPKKRLSDMIVFSNGKSIKPGGEGEFPVYGSNGIIGYGDQPREKNGVIIGRVGAYCGSVEYCPDRFWASDNTIVAYPKTDGYSIHFIYYLLKDLNLHRWASGAAQPLLTQSVLNQIEAFSPIISIQQKVAAILSAYDDLIANNLRRIKILEEMAQAIYREWFVKFRFPGHQKVKMVNSPLGKIPEGWEVKRLSDVCSILMGQSPKSEFYNVDGEGLPFHQGVTDFGERFPTTRVYCTFSGRIAEAGDILFSVRAPVGRLNLTDRKIIIGRGLSAIRNLNGYQCFTFHQLKEIFAEEDIMGGGTIFKAVTKGDMERIKCLYPPMEHLVLFEKICSPIGEQLAALGKKNVILRQTRDLLLPKLISGEMDVSEMDIAIREANA